MVLAGADRELRAAPRIECRLHDSGRGVTAHLLIEVEPSVQRVREVLIRVDDDREPMSPAEVKALPIAQYRDAILERALWSVKDFPPGFAATKARERAGGARKLPSVQIHPVVQDSGSRLRAARAAGNGSGRKPVTPERLEQVARLYRAALEDPDTTSTARYVASRIHLSEPTARKLIMRARAEGFLGPALGTKAGEATEGER